MDRLPGYNKVAIVERPVAISRGLTVEELNTQPTSNVP